MEKRFLITILFLIPILGLTQSPCGPQAPPPFDNCSDVCILCDLDQMNGYGGSSGSYTPDGTFSCGSTENNQWFAFMAAQPIVTITITPYGCSNGEGVQVAMFEGSCGGPEVGCATPGGGGAMPVSITVSTTVGEAYFVMVDGYGGDNCSFNVTAIGGGNVQVGNAAIPSGPILMCTNGTGTYTIPPVPGASQLTWNVPPGATVNGMPGPVTLPANSGNSVTVEFGSPASGQICVTPENACNMGVPSCLTIQEKTIPPTTLPPVSVCSGQCYRYIDGNDYCSAGTMSVTLQTSIGCDSLVEQDLILIDPTYTDLGTFYVCPGQCVNIAGQTFCNDGQDQKIISSQVAPYCDSILTFTIEYVIADADMNAVPSDTMDCVNNFVLFLPIGMNNPYGTETYAWYDTYGNFITNDPTFQTSETGEYTVIVQNTVDQTTCTDMEVVHVYEDLDIPITNITAPLLPCNGSITINLSVNDVTDIKYHWTGPDINTGNQSVQDPLVSLPGTYIVTVTDSVAQCTTLDTIIVTQANSGVASISAFTNASCINTCDGQATASIVGGSAPYTYLWNDAANQTSATASNLCAGSYTVTITDAQGCRIPANVTITEPTAIQFTTSIVSPQCNQSNGQACVNVSGGTSPYTYLWNDAANQTTSCAYNLSVGNYSITITDNNGCDTVGVILLNNLNGPSVSLNMSSTISCYGICNGAVNTTVTGGFPPYSYQWDDPAAQTTPSATGLCVGTFIVTVTDAANCLAFNSITITQPDSFTVSSSSTQSDCIIPNGQACVILAGGTTPYTYVWNDPATQTTSCANNISAGVYQVTFQDANACTDSINVSVSSANAPTVSVSIGNNNLCTNDCTGTLQTQISGGNAPYSYLWNDPSAQTNSTAVNLCNGNYTVQVTDNSGCIAFANNTITAPTILISTISMTNSNCIQSTGSACVIASGGVAPYQYIWSDAGSQTSACATQLPQGWYWVTITDHNQCTHIDSVNVLDQPGPSISVTLDQNIACYGVCIGQASVSVIGGNAPYNYTWSDPASQSTTTALGLCAGWYWITVEDVNHCSSIDSVEVLSPTDFSIQNTIVNPNCNQNDGQICLQVAGATTPYAYLWSNSDNDSCANAIPAGLYSYTITDANGCINTSSINLTNNNTPSISTFVTNNASCNGYCDGVAGVNVSGGNAPYTYLWNDRLNQTTATANGLCAGRYTVTITESNNCSTSTSLSITEPPVLMGTVTKTEELCVNACDASMMLAASGGNGGYKYSIDNGANFYTSGTFNNLCGNMYHIKISDVNNCQFSDSTQIFRGTYLVDAFIYPEDTICSLSPDFNLTAQNPGGTWSGTGIIHGTNGTFSPQLVGAGTYDIYYTTNHICGETDTITLIVKQNYDATINPLGPICENDAPVLLNSINSGGFWSGNGLISPIPTFDPTMVGSGNHTITHYQPNACGDTSQLVIPVSHVDEIHITIPELCSNDPVITLSSLPTGYWTGTGISNGNPGIFNPSYAGPGTHPIYFINPNSCLDTQRFTVVVHGLPSGFLNASTLDGCSPLTVAFSKLAETAKDCYWNIGGDQVHTCDSVIHTFKEPGLYDISLTVIDVFGCKQTIMHEDWIQVYQNSIAGFGYVLNQDQGVFKFINTSEYAKSYLWSFGSIEENPVYRYPDKTQEEFIFCLKTNNDFGCEDSICQDMSITPPFYVYIPNTFTPNFDDLNENFYPVFSTSDYSAFQDYRFTIFNRWGEIVFDTHNPEESWNGTHNGTEVEQGIYTWSLFFIHTKSHTEINKNGHVNLLPNYK